MPNNGKLRTEPDNVYLLQQAAQSYKQAAQIPQHVFESVVDRLFKFAQFSSSISYRALDIGIGAGIFTIPILRGLLKRGIRLKLDGFDNSEYMLKELKKAIEADKTMSEFITHELRDAEDGLPESIFQSENYILVIITFVQHYLKNWKNILNDVTRAMKKRGILIQGEVLGCLRLVDGTFDTADEIDETFARFWKTYFEIRETFSRWDAEIRVSNLSPVNNYLSQSKQIELVGYNDFYYINDVSYNDMLLWIQSGVFSSVGSGLDDSQRNKLKARMQGWLREKTIDPMKKNHCKMGIRIWIHKKK